MCEMAAVAEWTGVAQEVATHAGLELAILRLRIRVRSGAEEGLYTARVVVKCGVVERGLIVAVSGLHIEPKAGRPDQMHQAEDVARAGSFVHQVLAIRVSDAGELVRAFLPQLS